MKKALKKNIFYLSIILVLIVVALKLFAPAVYAVIIREGKFLETTQCIVYFAAFVMAIVVAWRFWKERHFLLLAGYALLGLGLFFVSMEEISWGQGLFHFEQPEYFEEHNVQNEFTLHNLDTVQPYLIRAYMAIGFLGAFAWLLFPKRLQQQKIWRYLIPEKHLLMYFLPTFFIYLYLEFAPGIESGFFQLDHFFVARDQEPPELLLSMGFFFFVLGNWMQLKRDQSTGSSSL